MMVRAMIPNDIPEIKQIHEKFYKEEFDLPNFFEKFICAFIVKEDDKIISAGGIRPLAEAIIVTDKNSSVNIRRKALLEVMNACGYIAGKANFDQVHAFVSDEIWKLHLMRYNFRPCKGQALFVNLKKG